MTMNRPFYSIVKNYKNVFQARSTPYLYQQYQPKAGLKMEAREKYKELNIPEKPKKPMTPYFKFVNDHRDGILKRFPHLKVTDIAKKCAEDWRTTHATIKEKYKQEYKEELSAYRDRLDNYTSKLSEEQREFLEDFSRQKQMDKKKRRQKRKFRETNKPKKPMGAFMLYVMDQAKEKNISYKDMLINSKGKWQQLSPSEKRKYLSLYETEKIKYEHDLQKWEAKMIKEGNTDLVRQTSLVQYKPSHLHQKKTRKQ